MKISKLFHWLYALVMLLPIFAIGVTCGYAMFNKNAYQSYYGETINVNEEQSVTELKVGEEYNFNSTIGNFTYISNAEYIVSNLSNIQTNVVVDDSLINQIRFRQYNNELTINLYNGNTYLNSFIANSNNYFICTFEFDGVHNNDYLSFFTETIYKPYTYLSEVFYYSVDKVTQSTLFSWSYDSFLVAPFSYIVNLFGMPTNSVIVELLSYWLAISIIWLVFDLVMYVPLLVHRWIDKGVLE